MMINHSFDADAVDPRVSYSLRAWGSGRNQGRVDSRQAPFVVVIAAAMLWAFLAVSATAGDLRFKRHVISEQTDYSAAALIDVNHDGRIDIVCGGDWYEGPDWKKHFVAEIPRIGGRPDGFAHLEFDVNRDGWVDVITVNYRSRSIKWMEHPGESLGPWTTHVAVEPGPMETGRLVDVDGDGQLDLLPNGANFAAWWEFRWDSPDGPGEPAWIRHDLPEQAGGHGLGFGDIDGDGHGDIVGQYGWLQASGDARSGQWTWRGDFSLERSSIPMIVADVDDDDDSDIIWCSAHGFGIYWLEQDQDDSDRRVWHRHAIDTSWSQGHSPLWVDMDGDGRNELVIGKRYMAHGGFDPGEYDPIVMYRYQYNPATRTWNRWTIAEVGERVGIGLDPKVADIDGDGDLDLLTSGRSGLYWMENLGPTRAEQTVATPVPYDDRSELMMVRKSDGTLEAVTDPEQWGTRRWHSVDAIVAAHGGLPGTESRVPLDLQPIGPPKRVADAGVSYTIQPITYRIDALRTVSAVLYYPDDQDPGSCAGVVSLYEPDQKNDTERLADAMVRRGMVCVTVPLVGGRGDVVLDGVWQSMRATDVLQATDAVYGERLALVSAALQGRLGLYAAAIDQRLIATAADARSMSQWTDLEAYSLSEVLASVAPRSLALRINAEHESQWQAHTDRASQVFQLRNVNDHLQVAESADVFDNAQQMADWIENKLRSRSRRLR